ncbi:hypothetical protein [Nonomuraea sp. SYSU D8015]|uniref:hypothetical protein n=1 Tax=Nonomuraea sp. SYSU D8015 TaxID=2593644 RepID=UPI001CB745D9|nr:hypothetical protein [Nonomuraea sp. SYSU D8015]
MVDWVRLELDVDDFDDAAFEPYLARARESGIVFTTMAEKGDTEEHRRALYELNRTCSADIPDRGDFYTYDALRRPAYRGAVIRSGRSRPGNA